MPKPMPLAAAVEAVVAGARIVKLSDREREIVRIPAGYELVAKDSAELARFRRLLDIRVELETEREIHHR